MELLVVHKSGTIDVLDLDEGSTLTVDGQSFALDGIDRLVLTDKVSVEDVTDPAPVAPEPEPKPAKAKGKK